MGCRIVGVDSLGRPRVGAAGALIFIPSSAIPPATRASSTTWTAARRPSPASPRAAALTCVCFCHPPPLGLGRDPRKAPSRCADEGESGSGADDISRRAAAWSRDVPGRRRSWILGSAPSPRAARREFGGRRRLRRCRRVVPGHTRARDRRFGPRSAFCQTSRRPGLSWVLSAVRCYRYRRANSRVLVL